MTSEPHPNVRRNSRSRSTIFGRNQSAPSSQASSSTASRSTRRTADNRAGSASLKQSLDQSKQVSSQDGDQHPEPECRRTTRHQDRPLLAYNTRYHPADDVLRPHQAARLKATSKVESYIHSEVSDEMNDLAVEASSESEEVTSESLDNGCEDIRTASFRKRKKLAPQDLELNCRRSSRNHDQGALPNYNMKYVFSRESKIICSFL